jgi:hypothetical protein
MKIILYLCQILVILFSYSALAEGPTKNRIATITPWEFGLSTGVSIYGTSFIKELNSTYKRNSFWWREANPAIGLLAVRNISPSVGIEVSWINTRLSGNWNKSRAALLDVEGRESPISFNSTINQFGLMMVFNLSQIMLPGDDEDRGHLFIKTGIGISLMKDNKNFYPDVTSAGMSYALGGGYSVSLNERIKLQIGSTTIAINSDNMDGLHVVPKDNNGQILKPESIIEIYNYSYLSMIYRIGDFGSGKYKSTYKRRR